MRNLLNFILRFVAPMALALGALTTTPTRGGQTPTASAAGGLAEVRPESHAAVTALGVRRRNG